MSKNTVCVYDTITKRYVEIEVSEKVRTYYDRTQWNIDGNLENFHEFRTENDAVEKSVIQNIEFERLYKCLDKLTDDEQKLVTMIYFENKTEAECASLLHTMQQNIHKKKRRILCKLNKLLKSQ